MSRKRLTWLLMMAALTLAAAATAPAFPWQEEEAPAPAEPQEEASPDQTVETILREQEQLLTGQRFTYDPQGRRDPFRNLFDALGGQFNIPEQFFRVTIAVSIIDVCVRNIAPEANSP